MYYSLKFGYMVRFNSGKCPSLPITPLHTFSIRAYLTWNASIPHSAPISAPISDRPTEWRADWSTYIHNTYLHTYMHTYIYSTPSTIGASKYTYILNTYIFNLGHIYATQRAERRTYMHAYIIHTYICMRTCI